MKCLLHPRLLSEHDHPAPGLLLPLKGLMPRKQVFSNRIPEPLGRDPQLPRPRSGTSRTRSGTSRTLAEAHARWEP
jgi:hypothetical protein